MAFILTKNNKKKVFNSAYLSSLLSEVYTQVYGADIYKHRDEIISLTDLIYSFIEDNYGKGENLLYDVSNIHFAIKKHLPKDKPYLLEQFLLLFENNNIDKNKVFYWNVKVVDKEEIRKSFLTFKENKIISFENNENKELSDEENNRQENVFGNVNKEVNEYNIFSFNEQLKENEKYSLSDCVNQLDFIRYLENLDQQVYDKIVLLKKDWIDFLENLSIDFLKQNPEISYSFQYIRQAIGNINKNISITDEEWYDFFYNLIFDCLKDDPRLIYFIRHLQVRKNTCDLLGISWLQGTSFNEKGLLKTTKSLSEKQALIKKQYLPINYNNIPSEEEHSYYTYNVFLEDKLDFFKLMFRERFSKDFNLNSNFFKKIDFNFILEKLSLDLESKTTWLAYHTFKKAGCLKTFNREKLFWKDPEINNFLNLRNNYYQNYQILLLKYNEKIVYEPIQWAFLKVSLVLTYLFDKLITDERKNLFFNEAKTFFNFEHKINYLNQLDNLTDLVVNIYHLLSNLHISLPLQLFKELNLISQKELENYNINLFKNYSTFLEDNYDHIQNSITQAIIKTKWTGQANLDFSKIRKINTPINNGLRISNGISPYINMLYELVKSQGREENNIPISVSIPIHHYELFSLLKTHNNEQQNEFDKFKSSLSALNNSKSDEFNIQEEMIFQNLEKNNFDYLNRIIIISDLFLKRVLSLENENSFWYLLDPYFFNNLGLDLTQSENYLKAEQLILNHKVPKQHFKKLNAKYLLTRLINQSKNNNLIFVFENNAKNHILDKNSTLCLGTNGNGFSIINHKNDILNNLTDEINTNNKTEELNYSLIFNLNVSNCFSLENKNIDFIFLKKLSIHYFLILYTIDRLSKSDLNNENKKTVNLLSNLFGLEELFRKQLKYSFKFNEFGMKDEKPLFNSQIFKEKKRTCLNVFYNILQPLSLFNEEEFLSKENNQTYNDFINLFNKNREQEYLELLSIEQNKLFDFSHIFSHNFGFFKEIETNLIFNVRDNNLGIKESLIEVYEDGIKRVVHTPDFLLEYQDNNHKHYLYSKAFQRKAFSFYKKNNITFYSFFPINEDIYKEVEFFKTFIPFLKKGINLTLSKYIDSEDLKIILLNAWFHGVYSVRFV